MRVRAVVGVVRFIDHLFIRAQKTNSTITSSARTMRICGRTAAVLGAAALFYSFVNRTEVQKRPLWNRLWEQ